MTEPSDWQGEIVRAYEAFGLWDRVKGIIKNPEFEKKIKRGKHTGRFEEKPDAFIPEKEKEVRADIDLGPVESATGWGSAETDTPEDKRVRGMELIPEAEGQFTPEKIKERHHLYLMGLENVPPIKDEPVLDEHIIQDRAHAEGILRAAGASEGEAREYADTGLVITRNGKNFVWIPFDTGAKGRIEQEKAMLGNQIMGVFDKQNELRKRMDLVMKTHQRQVAQEWQDSGDPRWEHLVEAVRLDRAGEWNKVMPNGATADEIVREHRRALDERAAAGDAPEDVLGYWREKSRLDDVDRALRDKRDELEYSEENRRPLSDGMVRKSDGSIGLSEERREWVKHILDGQEHVRENLPAKMRQIPSSMRKDYTVVEALSREETVALYADKRGLEALHRSLGWTSLGGNRMVINVGNIKEKVRDQNKRARDPKLLMEDLAWSMPSRTGVDGSGDLRKLLLYTVAHESGHQYDIPKTVPESAFAMTLYPDKVMEMIKAGGLGQYAHTISPQAQMWQSWEAVAEAFAHYMTHDKFQPAHLRLPAVQQMIELFDLEQEI